MAEARRLQLRAVIAWLITAAMFVALAGHALTEPVGTDPANRAIARSAFWPVTLWCFGWMIAFAKPGTPIGPDFGVMRFQWSLACLLCWVHIAVAFHIGHGWSHRVAWEHTKQVGGYGDGVFVNYAFALVWLADALWACIAFHSYLTRPSWLKWTIHGFIAFVVFNAAVVFASWGSRINFVTWFFGVLLAVRYLKRRFWAHRIESGPNASGSVSSPQL